jgi:ADP-heptose:LPS heptosyltransferase
MNKKYSIFHLQGGIGKHIAATAVARAIKNNHPDRKLIVVCAYPEIFINLSFVDRVFTLGNTSYFYQEYIQDKDSIIFHHEPYYTTDHIHKRKKLIENWCALYNLKYSGELPELKFNKLQYDISKTFWNRKKPLMVLHTNGGMMTSDAKPYSWTRDMPMDIAQELVDHYKKDYHIFQITKLNSPKLKDAEPIFATPQQSLSLIELFSILLHSKKRILIDSSVQHAAAAMKRKSTVLWNGTSPKVFGYDLHDNICTDIPYDFKLPNSYLFDFDFNGNEVEYPFTEEVKLFDINTIIDSVNKQ